MSEPISTAVTGVAVAAGKEITATASKGIGQTVSDIWYVVFGAKWDEERQKKQIEVANNVDKFKEEITNKSTKILDENRIEPDVEVIGSTLESAKFRINKDEIRDMFSNLIVSAMDSSKANDIHPSFSEMIKMLSPLDAQNLYSLYHGRDETISKIRVTNKENDNYTDHFNHVFLGNPECQDNNLIESSIDNLIRLKLVDVSYSEYKSDDSLYDKHRENELFLKFKTEQEELQQHNTTLLNFLLNGGLLTDADTNVPLPASVQENVLNQLKQVVQEKEIEVVKGLIQLTAFGKNFCKVCL
ncbi:DUF4393 domain-containing protein [Haemophilus influenzae]|uniref:DUF4393 domain-containing protein n=1 Tax=Haemophilus influenzae TaxID=727 RepID=UPI0005BEC092|nr:DUF4393 domain-containing protein [Haemophilus influenzae]AJO88448.1 hypothetical protein NTHI477_01474 [Haemophilus influenzae]PRI99902.1 hypothetical protein BV030_01240 [Haemophilus influenzae]PRL86813.1 hypothetical protein BV031_00262 [Haemophilus influenzae]CWW92750.1 Uncharacterised protein [Haemophilus influenzae]CWX43231.1 Uncharacterised protein [Haemophilus influenzae]